MYSTCFITILMFWGVKSLNSPNFVFILTDDQDVMLNSMKSLPRTQEHIAMNGVSFENAYVNSPICCPSRSSILTGKYAHNIKVFNNSLEGNCSSSNWQQYFEKNSIASYLKNGRNYTTFYAGKYLNQYGNINAGGLTHIPAGYDWWLGLKGNSKYYNYSLSVNGTEKFYTNQYLTDTMTDFALDFLRTNYLKPFFITLATPACHAPFSAAKRHSESFPDEEAVRNPPFNHSAETKHWIVKMPPKHLPANISHLNLIQRKRLQTLLAVDDMVHLVVQELKRLNVHSNTYLIFTSDNGYHIGQFGQPWDKRQPYETDVRVPFLMSGPGVPRGKILSSPVAAVDIAPTILNLAGVRVPEDMDGESIKDKMLTDTQSRNILVEYWGEGNIQRVDKSCPWEDINLSECNPQSWCKCQDSRNNTYSCILHLAKDKRFKMCRFYDDLSFVEAYDLIKDPFELTNVADNIEFEKYVFYRNLLHKMEVCAGKNCRI